MSSCKSTPEQKAAENPFDCTSIYFTAIEYKKIKRETKGISIEIEENGYYDILYLYYQVENLLKNQASFVDLYNEKKEKLEWIIINTTDAKELRLAKDQLFQLEQSARDANQLASFTLRAKEIIEKYRVACSESSVYDFIQCKTVPDAKKQKEQEDILSAFLSLCQEYTQIKTNNRKQLSWKCCENPRILSDGCMNYCTNCPATFASIDTIGTFNDQKRIAANSKPKYYNIKHFISAIKKSQGIHKKTLDPMIDKKQDEYMKHHHITLEDYTIYNLMDLLTRDTSLASYYKDIHLIYRQKTGKQINNLGNVERELPKWYKEQDRFSETIKLREDGVNSINAYYMVCRLAQLKGGRIDLELKNFFCAKNPKTIEEYDICFEKRCYALGWLKPHERLSDYCK